MPSVERLEDRISASMTASSRRTHFGLGLPELFCLVAYATIVLCLVPHHEPWTDEAQGWLIANSCSLKTILGRVLHYEVAPPLWQFILWPLAKLHLPFRAANCVTATAGILSAYLALRYAPFPSAVRCALPFTFFLQYQFAIIARPYALFPPLLFAACVLYRRNQARSLLFALITGLLANIDLHCTMYAAFLFAGCVLSRRASREQSAESHSPWTRQRSPALLLLVFCAFLAIVVAVAFPAPDQILSGSLRRFRTVTSRVVPPEQQPAGMSRDPAESSAAAPAAHISDSAAGLAKYAIRTGEHTVGAMFYSVSQYNFVAAAFLIFCLAWLVHVRQPLLLLPLAGMLLAFCILPTSGYHTGLFLVALVGSLWMTWPVEPVPGRSWFRLAFATVCAIVLMLQIDWTVRADVGDFRGNYDPSETTARFLQDAFPNRRLAAFSYASETLILYGPFHPLGWQHPFWTWSEAADVDGYKASILAMHPDVVITGTFGGGHRVEGQLRGDPKGEPAGEDVTRWWEARGWRVTHRFCGRHFGFGSYQTEVCQNVLELPKS